MQCFHEHKFTPGTKKVIQFLTKKGSWRHFAIMFAAGVFCLHASLAYAFDPSIMQSVVRIQPDWPLSQRGRDATGAPRNPQGSGIAVLPGGYIATNAHVIGEAKRIEVILGDGRSLEAEIVGTHHQTDIALLRIVADLPAIEMAPPPPLGSTTCAVGNQFGLGLAVTCGVVSAVGRSGTGFNEIEDFIQTDAAVNPGSSGGALVDSQSRLIGMVSAIFGSDGDANIGVNFATSVQLLMRVVNDLKAYGYVRTPDIGFRVADIPSPLSSKIGGVIVEYVDPTGAAFHAGLEAGDILTEVNSFRVSSADVFGRLLFLYVQEDNLKLGTRRGAQVRELELKISE